VPNRREAFPPEHVALSDAHVLRGHGGELTPEHVERLAVEPTRGALEARRVDEVRRADLRDPDGQPGMAADERPGGARVVEVDVRQEQVADVLDPQVVLRQPGLERGQSRTRPAVEEGEPVVGVDDVDADRVRLPAEVQVKVKHRVIFAIAAAVSGLVFASAAYAQLAPPESATTTVARLIHYVAHDGVRRSAWLLLPLGYHGQKLPLVISPHGRGVDETTNAQLWGDLPGEGGFAVINPAGEGRRLHWYSWGAPGQIADLARMPAIAAANGVNVDHRHIYAVGGSMGGQETLLLLARHPHLLAGAIAFDPATNMTRRYYDFAALKDGKVLQALARTEIGGTPSQVPRAYARRSPSRYVRQLAEAGVPLQIYWSIDDRVIADQRAEAGRLSAEILALRPDAHFWDFEGTWAHTAEMQSWRRLPRSLARFGLLPWREVPPLPATPTRAPVQTV
jgi:pimeloyl-ACP methyl ester carboxylesterase